jgi:hypothetical protein
VLAAHGLVNTEEKRRGVADLGGQIVSSLGYDERWAMSASKVLIEKCLITTQELGVPGREALVRLARLVVIRHRGGRAGRRAS